MTRLESLVTRPSALPANLFSLPTSLTRLELGDDRYHDLQSDRKLAGLLAPGDIGADVLNVTRLTGLRELVLNNIAFHGPNDPAQLAHLHTALRALTVLYPLSDDATFGTDYGPAFVGLTRLQFLDQDARVLEYAARHLPPRLEELELIYTPYEPERAAEQPQACFRPTLDLGRVPASARTIRLRGPWAVKGAAAAPGLLLDMDCCLTCLTLPTAM